MTQTLHSAWVCEKRSSLKAPHVWHQEGFQQWKLLAQLHQIVQRNVLDDQHPYGCITLLLSKKIGAQGTKRFWIHFDSAIVGPIFEGLIHDYGLGILVIPYPYIWQARGKVNGDYFNSKFEEFGIVQSATPKMSPTILSRIIFSDHRVLKSVKY